MSETHLWLLVGLGMLGWGCFVTYQGRFGIEGTSQELTGCVARVVGMLVASAGAYILLAR